LQKHKKGKRITNAEVKEVLALLDRGKSKSAVARETGISQSKVYRLWSEKLARDADERAIQQREEEDRKRPCVQHVFIREIIKEDSPKTVATSRTEKIIEVKRCRLYGFEERRSRFLQIN
jgi:predicted transcriptional regulator